MNIEVNKTNVTVDGDKLIIEKKPLYECKVGEVIVDNIGNEWYVVEQDVENLKTKVWRKELLEKTYSFDEITNDFSESEIKNILNDENGNILNDIYKGFGKENVLIDTVDLLDRKSVV